MGKDALTTGYRRSADLDHILWQVQDKPLISYGKPALSRSFMLIR